MKLTLTILSAVIGLSNAVAPSNAAIPASSEAGQKLLSKARRLNNDNNNNNGQDYTWIANMALKFQGCYTTKVWNEEADGDEDVKISNLSLVRFRLCPADYCTIDSAAGCSEGYGDYVIDMATYLAYYLDAVSEYQEYQCEYEAKYGDCICDKDNADDNFNEDYCKYDCYMGKGMEYCVDRNPYEENNGNNNKQEQEQWELEKFAECQQYKFENNNNNGNNNNNNNNNQNNNQYYIGAYCAANGGKVQVGLFTDDTCTQFADSYGGTETFSTMTYGKSLPYSDSSTSLIGSECLACKEQQDANENDKEDEDNVSENCANLYMAAGKCESGLSISYPNTYACSFMEGIKIERKTGAVVQGSIVKNQSVSIVIGAFACVFVLLGGYSYYLRNKLARSKVDIAQE